MDAEKHLERAAAYMSAALAARDDAQFAALAEASGLAMVEVMKLRTGLTGDLLPRDIVEQVRAEVLERVREKVLGVAKTAAAKMCGLKSEAEVNRVWGDALRDGLSIRN